MTEQSPDPDLKENNYREWVEGQSTKELELELISLELERVVVECSDPEFQMDQERAEREERRQELLAKIHEKDPKKRAKAREEVEDIIVEEYDADFPRWIDQRAKVNRRIVCVQNELQARRVLELSKSKPKTTINVAARRAVIRANASLTAFQICEVLDDKEIELPPGEEWNTFREREDPWATAYRQGGEKFRRRIRVIISKDKSA
jgi:dsDNA-specific endonuclease/ATPase MutS2